MIMQIVTQTGTSLMLILQGEFELSLTQDGYLPAAFLVRCAYSGFISLDMQSSNTACMLITARQSHAKHIKGTCWECMHIFVKVLITDHAINL